MPSRNCEYVTDEICPNLFVVANAPISDESSQIVTPDCLIVRDICGLYDCSEICALVFQGVVGIDWSFKMLEKTRYIHHGDYRKVILFLIEAGGLRHALDEYYSMEDRIEDDRFIIDVCKFFAMHYLVEPMDSHENAQKKIKYFIDIAKNILE